ncbi:hypothetical protein MUO14_03250 [Halobacillus shinanisalinarum]|uniref:Uncharacterized protein n=1 Tax=Halobacillus shinanisalinarum TaxID=2932258 RepID=A0ABY4H0M8_9BACI|nr:hypothetical protein [Halobacillus shinanisalinarum]UOQ94000.1 hypothetical protein MUO14_03250 [Halobacillus shinanisalinarum]
MAVKLKRFYLYLTTILFITIFPRQGLALEDKLSVTRSEVLNVAKEIHPPGCTDSRTADYCQRSSAYEVRGKFRACLNRA